MNTEIIYVKSFESSKVQYKSSLLLWQVGLATKSCMWSACVQDPPLNSSSNSWWILIQAKGYTLGVTLHSAPEDKYLKLVLTVEKIREKGENIIESLCFILWLFLKSVILSSKGHLGTEYPVIKKEGGDSRCIIVQLVKTTKMFYDWSCNKKDSHSYALVSTAPNVT